MSLKTIDRCCLISNRMDCHDYGAWELLSRLFITRCNKSRPKLGFLFTRTHQNLILFQAHILNHRCKCNSAGVNPNKFCKPYILLHIYNGDNLQYGNPTHVQTISLYFLHFICPLSIPTPPPIQPQLLQMWITCATLKFEIWNKHI